MGMLQQFRDKMSFGKQKTMTLRPSNPNLEGAISKIRDAEIPDTPTTAEPERAQWGSRAEFFLSCVGLSVGMGNVWRFPYLAYENGGGAFLIPYIIILILVGKPLYFMELAIGQYSSLGPWTYFKQACPIFGGVGVGMCVVSLIVCIYYNVLMSYTIFYIAAVFKSICLGLPLPWDVCDPEWANDRCFVRESTINLTKIIVPPTDIPILQFNKYHTQERMQPSPEQYFNRYVLQKETNEMSYSLENPGPIIWQLVLCLILCWILVFFCLVKGIQSSGKVVYFTSTFPYVILLVLMVRGVLLEGAVDGIIFLFKPQWGRLLDVSVWRSAASQVFFSLSVSWGGLIMFGSYNKFHLKVYKDALIVCSLDTVTSVIASIVIFSVLGNLAYQLDVPIATVAQGGQGLAFVAYPEALSKLPIPQLWAVLFFFMLFILGIDSQFGMLETVLTAIYDEYPMLRAKKAVVTGLSCVFCFCLALPCLTHGGLYVSPFLPVNFWFCIFDSIISSKKVIDLMDTYGGGFAIILISFFEIIAVFWIYGQFRLVDNIYLMMQYKPSLYFRTCWMIVAPIVLLFFIFAIIPCLQFIFIYSMADYKPFATTGHYPAWGDGIGWILALLSILQIPIWAVVMVCRQKGSFVEPINHWGPSSAEAREEEELAYGCRNKFELHEPSPRSEWRTVQVTDLDASFHRHRVVGIENPAFVI